MVKARAANRIDPVYEHWKPLTDEEFGKCMTDFEEFCKHSIILDKNGSPVTFNLNNAQRVVAKEILKALDPIMKKVPCPSIKVLIHKSRQMGITTLFLKLEQFFMTKTKNLNALHVMPTEEECDELKDRKLIPLLPLPSWEQLQQRRQQSALQLCGFPNWSSVLQQEPYP